MDDVTVSIRAQQPAAVVRSINPMSEMGQQLGDILPAISAAVIEKGRTPTQPPFRRYLDMDMVKGTLVFEAGMAVDASIADAAPVHTGVVPGGEVAALWHIGPYHELGSSHERLDAWIAAQGRRRGDGRWEVYWTDPGQEPDSSTWRTEVLQVLAPRG
jgi:effector-binding domain-containing protein